MKKKTFQNFSAVSGPYLRGYLFWGLTEVINHSPDYNSLNYFKLIWPYLNKLHMSYFFSLNVALSRNFYSQVYLEKQCSQSRLWPLLHWYDGHSATCHSSPFPMHCSTPTPTQASTSTYGAISIMRPESPLHASSSAAEVNSWPAHFVPSHSANQIYLLNPSPLHWRLMSNHPSFILNWFTSSAITHRGNLILVCVMEQSLAPLCHWLILD